MKKVLLSIAMVAVVVLLVIGAGCTSTTTDNTVKAGDTVNVYYTMYVDGEEIQSNVGSTPFTFVIDGGNVISGFNNAVKGMKVGETKKVTIPPAEGYGEKTTDYTQKLSLKEFEGKAGQTFKVGDEFTVSGSNGTNLMILVATVLSIDRNNDELVVALNQELAGKTLVYDITLDSIQKA